MASEVSIINRALNLLGSRPITARTDATEAARVANASFDDIRDELLRAHPWNFATKRVSLAASATAPTWEFDNAFVVPSDYLRIVDLYNASDVPWRLENTTDGRVIATDISAPLKIAYTARITDPDLWDEGFRRALIAKCAAEWAERITGSSDRASQLLSLADREVSQARNSDGQEMSQRQYEATDWIDART